MFLWMKPYVFNWRLRRFSTGDHICSEIWCICLTSYYHTQQMPILHFFNRKIRHTRNKKFLQNVDSKKGRLSNYSRIWKLECLKVEEISMIKRGIIVLELTIEYYCIPTIQMEWCRVLLHSSTQWSMRKQNRPQLKRNC